MEAVNAQLRLERDALAARLEKYESGFTQDASHSKSNNSIYNEYASSYQVEENQRASVHKVFDLFRANKVKKGGLTNSDLQDMALHMGLDLTSEESRDLIAQFGNGRATLNFEDFYDWWKSPLAEASLGASAGNILLLKLKAKSYLRVMGQFLKELEDVDKPDLNAQTVKVAGQVTAGDFGAAASAASVRFSRDPAIAKASREELKASPTAIIFSVSFSLRPGIDEFELGELAGTIGDLLLMGKKNIQFHSHKCQLVKERGETVMRFSVFYDEHEKIDKRVRPYLRKFDLRHVEGRAECSQSPSDPPQKEGDDTKSEFVKARGQGKLEIGALAVELINEQLHRGEKPSFLARWNLFSAFRNVDFNLDLGCMERAYEKFALAMENDTPLFKGVRGFSSLKPLLMPIGQELYTDHSIPAPVKDAYFSAINFLRGVHTIRVQFDDQILTIEGEHADVFDLLPTRAELTNWTAPLNNPQPVVAPNPMFSNNEFKMAVLGENGSGKSATVVQFVQNIFVEFYDPTIEDSYRKQVEFAGQMCMLDIFDSVGDTGWGMYQMVLAGAQGYVLLFSITSEQSFEALAAIHAQIMALPVNPAMPRCLIMVGNKSDLEHERRVSVKQAQDQAAKWGIPYIECSAKTRTNTDIVFQALLGLMLQARGHKFGTEESSSTTDDWFLTPPHV